MSAIDDIRAAAEKVKADGKSKPRVGRHPVNQPMIDHCSTPSATRIRSTSTRRRPRRPPSRHRCAAGDDPGLDDDGPGGVRPDDDPLGKIITLFDEAGYIGVVATNCEQTYHRYLRPGEEVSVSAELTDVVARKRLRWARASSSRRRSPGLSATRMSPK